MRTSLIFLLACFVQWGGAASILGIFHVASHSHYTLGRVLMEGLADRGHEVTFVTPYKGTHPKVKYVVLTGVAEAAKATQPHLDRFGSQKMSFWTSINIVHHLGLDMANKTFEHPNFKKLLDSEQRFDVVIVEQFVNEAFRGICHYYGSPCVVFSAIEGTHWVNIPAGNPQHPSYIPAMQLEHVGPMDLYTRTKNLLMETVHFLFYHFRTLPDHNALMQKAFPNTPPLQELIYNPHILLMNTHMSKSTIAPLMPGMIEIGGYHIEPSKELPEDLRRYLDDAKDGVVYFSMGSVLKSKDFPEDKRNAIFRAFAKLKMKVLWKFEQEDLPGKPENVRIMKWVPQRDVLAHPNVKLFISHGGMLSTTEASFHGVPFIGIPIFGDQHSNTLRAVHSGYALHVPYLELREDTLTMALDEILSNKRYAESAKRISSLMADRPMKPLDTAIFWVEYATRNKNLEHLKPLSLNLTWYQYLFLDVLGLALAALLIGVVCLRKLCLALCASKNKSKRD